MLRLPSHAALLRAAWLRGAHPDPQPQRPLQQSLGQLGQQLQAWAPARLFSRHAARGGPARCGAGAAAPWGQQAAQARRGLTAEAEAAAQARMKPGGRDIDYQSPARRK
jgi:hypothetical protein